MSKNLADNIVTLRKKHGLSQEQFAEKISVSRQTVSNWERGIAVPDVETLNLIAKLFDTDLSAIVNGENSGTEKQKDTLRHRTALLLASAALMIVHFILAFSGKIYMFPVVIVPGLLVGLSALIHFAFRHTTAQNDFSIIAGFDKKKDNIEIVRKQLATIDLLNLAVVFLFNILFFAMYVSPEDSLHISNMIFLGIYILTFITIVVGVNLKMKSR
ncbi:MAG: helix-turn-helix domain-containing protein [Clostridiales bacterium]|jgi:transcriptional regulator with XRE-family HTH domain|nr:helix-turn-helix domain-containing protein [Clostridiales bacterium]